MEEEQARAAIYALKVFLGFEIIYMVNRCKSETEIVMRECTASGFGAGLIHIATETEAKMLSGPGLVVSAIPNLPPTDAYEGAVRGIAVLMLQKSDTGVLLEMCYHPPRIRQSTNIAVRAAW